MQLVEKKIHVSVAKTKSFNAIHIWLAILSSTTP